MSESKEYFKKLKQAKVEPDWHESLINFAQVRQFFQGFALKNKMVLLGLLSLTICQAGVIGYGIWYLKYAIDLYFQSQSINALVLAVLLITLVKSTLEFFYRWGLNYYQMFIRDSLIEQAFSDLLHNDFYVHIKVRNSRKYGWVLEDTEKFIESMFALYQLFFRQPLQILSVFIAVFVINWQLALFGILAIPAILPIAVFMRKKAMQYVRQRRALLGLLEEKVAESVYAIRIVKTFGLEARETGHLRKILDKQREVFQKNAFYSGLMGPLTEFVGVIGLMLILFFGMQSIDSDSFSTGSFLAFIMAFLNAYRPLREISNGIYRYQLALDTGRRLISLKKNVNKVADVDKSIKIKELDKINIKDVCFSYDLLESETVGKKQDSPKWVLNHISLTLYPGETVLLAGMSGAGKSTLCDLLMGLFPTQKGEISINGHSFQNVAKSSLQNLIAMCSQETIVFDDSLLENIRVVDVNASEEQVRQVAEVVAMPAHLIERIYEPIGDRGISLSGGERQRLALARTVLRKPKLLVIDEAMNNIDPDTENKIWRNMKAFLPDTAFVVVSHRWLDLSYYDRLLVMGQGRILDEIQINDNLTTRQMFEQYRQALGLIN